MKKTTILRNLLSGEKLIVAPAAYDSLSARIIEQTGFKVVFTSDFCVNASLYARPALELETRTDIINQARNIATAIDIPLIVDIGKGYGTTLGVYQTVRELQLTSAAGCFIEDQASLRPKRDHADAKGMLIDVIPVQEYLRKLGAAIEAREDKDFVIIARTDSAIKYGFNEALNRGRAYLAAGADLIVPIGIKDKAALSDFIVKLGGNVMIPPNFASGLTLKDYEEIGVKIVSGTESLLAAARAVKNICEELKIKGFIKMDPEAHRELLNTLRIDKWIDLERKYPISND